MALSTDFESGLEQADAVLFAEGPIPLPEKYLLGKIARALEANPQSVADFRSGKEKAFGFLVGQVMRELKGKADPKLVNELLHRVLQGS